MAKDKSTDMVEQMRAWIGYNETNGKFKEIIDIYNSCKPLARGYPVKYTDEWCATTVSAAAIQCGTQRTIVPLECGCEEWIELAKKLGIWEEDGTIVPKPGYIILYSWRKDTQPNNARASHIGVVEAVSGNEITVIEGNKKEAVGRRVVPVGWGYIRGYGIPKYSDYTNSNSQSSNTTTPTNYPKTSNVDEKKIWDFLKSLINNNYAVAGIMGNLYAESALKSVNLEIAARKRVGYDSDSYTDAVDSGKYTNFINDKAGYGLAQWTYWTRKQGLYNYAKLKKASIGNLDIQLEYLAKELPTYTEMWKKLQSITTVRAASDLVLINFENPDDKSEKVKKTRASYAQSFYDKYAGTDKLNRSIVWYGVVNAGTLNVRTGAGINYPNISKYPTLSRGTKIGVCDTKKATSGENWYYVCISGSAGTAYGYVSAAYIQKQSEVGAQPENDPTTKPDGKLQSNPVWYATVSASSLNIRTGAGTANPRLKTYPALKQGTTVELCDSVYAPDGSLWYYIRINKKTYGFASAAYLKKTTKV